MTSTDALSEMDYRPLGSSGLMVSARGIGCNAFGRRVDQDGAVSILAAARDNGVTLLDTADIYSGELGQSDARDLDLLDVAIGGLAAQPAVTSVIAGATAAEQVARNAQAAGWQPTAADLAEMDEL